MCPKLKLDLFDKAILKILYRFDIPLTMGMIGTETMMSPQTAKIRLLKLEKMKKVIREGKKWRIVRTSKPIPISKVKK